MSESLTIVELETEVGEALPERAVLALLNINSIVAANVAAAVNAGTINSGAFAFAGQHIHVSQS